METQEIWKDIPEYEGLYQVSNLGNVKSLGNSFKRKEKLLKPQICKSNGYLQVTLSIEGKLKTIKIHQLVAIAFLNHTQSGMKLVIDHISGDILDNSLSNLRIVENRENTNKMRYKSNASSRFTGVSWYKNSKKWRSQIQINSKVKHLGLFDTEEEAYEAYQNALKSII